MVFPIVVYGHPVLRKPAKDIDENYEGLEKYIENMWATMYDSDGVGLASPQVGKDIRLFVIDATVLEDDEPELADFKKVFINAQILERRGDKVSYEEGCLSVPAMREEVVRESEIHIQYYDENWEFHDEWYEGIAARIIQHEYDHIEGILYTDRVSPIRKRMIRGKLQAISKGKYEVSYKTKLPNNKVVFAALSKS